MQEVERLFKTASIGQSNLETYKNENIFDVLRETSYQSKYEVVLETSWSIQQEYESSGSSFGNLLHEWMETTITGVFLCSAYAGFYFYVTDYEFMSSAQHTNSFEVSPFFIAVLRYNTKPAELEGPLFLQKYIMWSFSINWRTLVAQDWTLSLPDNPCQWSGSATWSVHHLNIKTLDEFSKDHIPVQWVLRVRFVILNPRQTWVLTLRKETSRFAANCCTVRMFVRSFSCHSRITTSEKYLAAMASVRTKGSWTISV